MATRRRRECLWFKYTMHGVVCMHGGVGVEAIVEHAHRSFAWFGHNATRQIPICIVVPTARDHQRDDESELVVPPFAFE